MPSLILKAKQELEKLQPQIKKFVDVMQELQEFKNKLNNSAMDFNNMTDQEANSLGYDVPNLISVSDLNNEINAFLTSIEGIYTASSTSAYIQALRLDVKG